MDYELKKPVRQSRKKSTEDWISDIIAFVIVDFVLAFIVEFIVVVVDFFNTSLWEKSIEFSWGLFGLCCLIAFVPTLFIALSQDSSKNVPRRNNHNDSWGGGETDYYDSDMEGAPGYYGND